MRWNICCNYLSLLILGTHALAFQDGVLAMQKKIAEAFYPVALPVLNECLEFFDSFHALLSGNGVVGACEHGGGSFNTF